MTEMAQVEVGGNFWYLVRYDGGKLTVQINDEKDKVMSTGKPDGPTSYFKVRNYNQDNNPSKVMFYDIDIVVRLG